MEKEQLILVLNSYRQALTNVTEEKFVLQALVTCQANQIEELNQQIQNLMAQLNEMQK